MPYSGETLEYTKTQMRRFTGQMKSLKVSFGPNSLCTSHLDELQDPHLILYYINLDFAWDNRRSQ